MLRNEGVHAQVLPSYYSEVRQHLEGENSMVILLTYSSPLLTQQQQLLIVRWLCACDFFFACMVFPCACTHMCVHPWEQHLSQTGPSTRQCWERQWGGSQGLLLLPSWEGIPYGGAFCCGITEVSSCRESTETNRGYLRPSLFYKCNTCWMLYKWMIKIKEKRPCSCHSDLSMSPIKRF